MTSDLSMPERMQRCGDIAQRIIFNWQQTSNLAYVLRATDSVQGLRIDELRRRRFLLGLTEQDLIELPVNDVLMVFALVEAQVRALQHFQGNLPPSFRTTVPSGEDLSNEQAAVILAQLRIETPHDAGKWLLLSPTPPPEATSPSQPPASA